MIFEESRARPQRSPGASLKASGFSAEGFLQNTGVFNTSGLNKQQGLYEIITIRITLVLFVLCCGFV